MMFWHLLLLLALESGSKQDHLEIVLLTLSQASFSMKSALFHSRLTFFQQPPNLQSLH